MNTFLYVIGALFILRGTWLVPSNEREARYRLAPYRALRGTIYVVFGVALCLIAAGVRALVVIAP